MNRINLALSIVFASVLLTSCASNEKITAARYSEDSTCCKSIAQLKFQPLAVSQSLTAEIDIDSPVLDLPQGKSRVASFEIPSASRSLQLRVKTTIVGIYMPQAFVFYPAVTMLDERKQIVETVEPDLTFERVPLAPTQTQGWAGQVILAPSVRYVVLHTPAARRGTLASMSTRPSGSVVMSGNIPIYVASQPWDQALPFAGVGRVTVELRNE